MTAKRVLISIDERLLARVDQHVERLGLTRSGYLAQLASADLESSGHPGGEARAAGLSGLDTSVEPPRA